MAVVPSRMEMVRPTSWAEALEVRATRPGLLPLAGGTDVMVELNLDRLRPEGLLDLSAITDPQIADWWVEGDEVVLGAAVTWTRVIVELAGLAPGLAMAAGSVGSPQIRNRGTIAGNLASASPAGDAHPPLLASGARIELESLAGRREIPIDAFFLGPKRSVLGSDELIRSVRFPVATGPQLFAKVGTRNAMVIAVASFALALDPVRRRAGTGIGSAGPTPLRAVEAERLVEEELDWAGRRPPDAELAGRFGTLVARAVQPVDDLRGTAAYRRHALDVLARRTLGWAWAELREVRHAGSGGGGSSG